MEGLYLSDLFSFNGGPYRLCLRKSERFIGFYKCKAQGLRCLLRVDSELKSSYQFFSLSLSHTYTLSHTHTHSHSYTHTHTLSLSLSLLCRTNVPHWAEKIAVSQAPHPSCSTLRMIKKRGCAGLHIHQLKPGLATLGESDFRTTGGVSQWHVYFLVVRASDCPLQPYLHQEAVVAHSCWVLVHGQPLSFSLFFDLSLSPVSNSTTQFFYYHHVSVEKVRHRQFK